MTTFHTALHKLRSFPLMRSLRDYLLWLQGIVFMRRYRKGPLEPRTVIFESYAGRSYSCSPRAIYRRMVTDPQFSDWRFTWSLVDPESAPAELRQSPRTTIVKYESPAYYRAFGTASYWVVNSMLPAKVRKRPGQKMLQCWHGTPFKRLRADVAGNRSDINGSRDFHRKNRLDVPRFDAFTFQSAFGERTLSSAFEFDRFNPNLQRIRAGLPRNAELFTYSPEKIAAIRESLGIERDKTVVLYAPTYRDDAITSDAKYSFSQPVDYQQIIDGLGADVVLLFRAHYMITEVPDFASFDGQIIDASQAADINDLYAVSDLLITDYSSVFFDFAALKRPVVFFMKDLENYRDNLRGFYLSLSELPGPVTVNEADLISQIKEVLETSGQADYPHTQHEELRSWDTAHSTDDAIERFFLQ